MTGGAAELDASTAALDAFVERVRSLTDEERAAVAQARAEVNEAFHERALRAGAEALVGRAEAYAAARSRVGSAHVPAAIGGGDRGPDPHWTSVARLMQLALDEMLVALVASDVLHPNHLRELSRPWTGYAAASTSSSSAP